jgi:hypothetical protein
MKIIGTPKCCVRYRYLSRKEVLNKSELYGLGLHEKMKAEFLFASFEKPKDWEKNALKLENGRILIEGTSSSIEELSIGTVGIRTWVYAHTNVATKVLEKTEYIIQSIQPDTQLRSLRKRIDKETKMNVKLDFDPSSFHNRQLVSFVKNNSDRFRATEFSDTETQFPVLVFAFSSRPNVEKILAKAKPEDVEIEMKSATRVSSFSVMAPSSEMYRERIFEIDAETDFDSTISMLQELEKTATSL